MTQFRRVVHESAPVLVHHLKMVASGVQRAHHGGVAAHHRQLHGRALVLVHYARVRAQPPQQRHLRAEGSARGAGVSG